jgi:hypothetical protein
MRATFEKCADERDPFFADKRLMAEAFAGEGGEG